MRFFIHLCLLLCWPMFSLAESVSPTPQTFNVKKANQQFDRINLQLSVQNLNLNHLTSAVNTLTALTIDADECVVDIQKKIKNLQLMIKQEGYTTPILIPNMQDGADQIYIDHQQKILANKQAQCKLFSIRAKEAIEAYKIAIAKLKQEKALTRGSPLWNIFLQTLHSPKEDQFINTLTKKLPDALPPLSSCILIVGASLLCSFLILKKFRQSRIAKRFLHLRKTNLIPSLILSMIFITGSVLIFSLLSLQEFSTQEIPLRLFLILLFYFISLLCTSLLFKIKNIRTIFYWYSLDYSFFQTLTLTLLSFYSLAKIGALFANSFNPNQSLWQLCESFFLLALLSTGIYFNYYFFQVHQHIAFIKKHPYLISIFPPLLFFTCGTINVFGYYTLAQHITYSGFLSIGILFILFLITHGIQKGYSLLYQQQSTKLNVMKYFGYKDDQIFMEFLILKLVIQIMTIAICLYWMGQSWEFATDYFDMVFDQLVHGVHLADMTFYPTRILAGLVVFCSLYLICRAISTSISRHQQFEDEEETQVAIASILTYVGFSIALISGFLIAGFNFTGLAIIAGALSVGIGLGLQGIVNNVVSGLILLIEKPIRPGDRINVEGLEGFVKKIRVRSTQIMTPSREDIIIPNSDLITRPVKNYMYSDLYCRINCDISVSYGTDTLLVRDILLDIMNQHEEVIKVGRSQPRVILRSLGNGALDFQFDCLIRDVNKKSTVQSELNFAIEQTFRAHHIELSSSQHDVNIKLQNLSTPSMVMEEIR